MAISGIGATPQPEQNNYDPVKEEEEQYAASIFQSLNKNGDNQIDEKDGLDNSMLKALKNFVGSTLTLENLKKVVGKLPEFTYTKTAQYNGRDAQITYNIWGQIRSVNTGAQNKAEAREHMALDKEQITTEYDGSKYKNMSMYGREYKKDNGIEVDYFVWNPETKSMDFECGIWRAYKWYDPRGWF